MRIKVNVMKLLKGSQGSKDAREWMHCLHIYKEGYAATTNGHLAFLTEKLEGKPISKDMVIKVNWTSFAGVDYYGIDEERKQLVGMNKDNVAVQFIPYNELESKPFDVKRVFDNHKPTTTGRACFDPSYLSVMSNFGKGKTVLFEMGEVGTPSLIKGEIGTYLLMPQTYSDRNLPKIIKK